MFEELQNQVFSGYLSADPEMKYFESGKVKTQFSIPLKNNKDDETKWLNCEAWGDIAERVGENLRKGSYCTVIGKFKTETYNEKLIVKFIVSAIL